MTLHRWLAGRISILWPRAADLVYPNYSERLRRGMRD